MKYLIFTGISLFLHGVCFWGLKRKKLISSNVEKEENKIYSVRQIVILLLGFMLLFVVQEIWLYEKMDFLMHFVRMVILYGIVLLCALIDWKTKIIPNKILLAGLGIRIVIYIIEGILLRGEIRYELVDQGIALLLVIVLVIFSLLCKKGIGMGDIKLFALIAIYTGAFCTYSVLFVSVFLGAVIGVVLMVGMHKDKKTTIAFGPFILLGYMLAMFVGSY